MIRWIAVALLFALPVAAGTFSLSQPYVGKVVCYGDSLCNSRVGDWPAALVSRGMTVGTAGVAGASADLASSATNSLEAQTINSAGCPSAQVDVFGDGLIDTCIADISWSSQDVIVIQIGTNDVSAGVASAWDATFGPDYQTALENVLTEIATTPAHCVLLLPIPRADLIDDTPDLEKYALIDTALRARQEAAVAAVGSDCQIVDTWTPLENYRLENGDAFFDLFDGANVHITTTPNSLGDSGVTIIGEHIRSAIYSMLGRQTPANVCTGPRSFNCPR